MLFFATSLHSFSSAWNHETLPWSSKLPFRAQTSPSERPREQVDDRTSTTCKKAIDFPAMRLVNVTTKKSRPIQRIEVFTKTVGVELPFKNPKGTFRVTTCYSWSLSTQRSHDVVS